MHSRCRATQQREAMTVTDHTVYTFGRGLSGGGRGIRDLLHHSAAVRLHGRGGLAGGRAAAASLCLFLGDSHGRGFATWSSPFVARLLRFSSAFCGNDRTCSTGPSTSSAALTPFLLLGCFTSSCGRRAMGGFEIGNSGLHAAEWGWRLGRERAI